MLFKHLRLLKSVVFIFVMALGVIVFATDSRSQGDLGKRAPEFRANVYCAEYVRQAYEDTIVNQTYKCGYTGHRWNPDRDAHLAFCERNNQDVINSERNARRDEADCCKYAAKALEAVLRASQNNCGFSGARYSPNLSAHRDWCNSVPRSFRDNEEAWRDRDWDACSKRR